MVGVDVAGRLLEDGSGLLRVELEVVSCDLEVDRLLVTDADQHLAGSKRR